MNRQTQEEALRIDAMGYDWTPHRNKQPLYPGWNRAPHSDPHFINTAFQETPFIANGIRTGRDKTNRKFLVIDFDERFLYDDFAARIRIDSTVALTRRGMHLFLRGESPNRIKINQQNIDIIAERKFVCAPVEFRWGQVIREWITPLRPVDKLAEFDPGWFPESPCAVRTPQERREPDCDRVEWARRILFDEYFSVAQAGGDNDLFRAACFLIQRARLDFESRRTWPTSS